MKRTRTLTDHKVAGLNEAIEIAVLDAPGHGGACHHYRVSIVSDGTNMPRGTIATSVNFQEGPVKENGLNGISQEALIAICIDRLRSFQDGPYACRENANALDKLEEAQMWLMKRTRDRLARGVEGTSEK